MDWGRLASLAGSLLSGVAGLASNLVFLLILLLFLSVEVSGVKSRLDVIGHDRPEVARALAGFATDTRKYIVVSTVFGLIVAVLDTIALLLMGIPLAFAWGLLAFITNYIPNVGFVIGVIPPALLGLLEGGPRLMIAVIIVYCVLNFVVQSLIQPRVVGDAVGLSVVVTFLALVFWTWLIGPIGAILAIPLTLLAKALLVDIDPRAGWADALLRNRPAVRSRPSRSGGRCGSASPAKYLRPPAAILRPREVLARARQSPVTRFGRGGHRLIPGKSSATRGRRNS